MREVSKTLATHEEYRGSISMQTMHKHFTDIHLFNVPFTKRQL